MRKSDVWAGLMDSLCWGLGLELGLLSTLSWYTSDRELWLLFSSAETAPGEEEHLDPGAQAAEGSTASWGLAEKAEHSQRVKQGIHCSPSAQGLPGTGLPSRTQWESHTQLAMGEGMLLPWE